MIRFAYNESSWRDGAPLPGSMADRMTQSIRDALGGGYVIDRYPADGDVNVYLSMPSVFQPRFVPGGVHIAHGVADKGIRVGHKLKDHFAWVTSPGPLFTRQIIRSGFPREKVVELGYPKIDALFNGDVEPVRPRDDRVRVVWAPTHGGGSEKMLGQLTPPQTKSANRSTFWRSGEVLSLLDPGTFDVVFAPHPRHRPNREATFNEYVGADVAIVDGGSTIYESLALGIPVVFCDWLTAHANTHQRHTLEARCYAEQIGYHAHRPEQLAEVVQQAAAEGIDEQAREFIDGIIPPETRGKSGQLHAEFLTGL